MAIGVVEDFQVGVRALRIWVGGGCGIDRGNSETNETRPLKIQHPKI